MNERSLSSHLSRHLCSRFFSISWCKNAVVSRCWKAIFLTCPNDVQLASPNKLNCANHQVIPSVTNKHRIVLLTCLTANKRCLTTATALNVILVLVFVHLIIFLAFVLLGITMKMANLWSPDCEQILEILPQKDNITSVSFFSSGPWATFIQLLHAIIIRLKFTIRLSIRSIRLKFTIVTEQNVV